MKIETIIPMNNLSEILERVKKSAMKLAPSRYEEPTMILPSGVEMVDVIRGFIVYLCRNYNKEIVEVHRQIPNSPCFRLDIAIQRGPGYSIQLKFGNKPSFETGVMIEDDPSLPLHLRSLFAYCCDAPNDLCMMNLDGMVPGTSSNVMRMTGDLNSLSLAAKEWYLMTRRLPRRK